MARHNDIGKEGERLAADYLITHGYTVRDVNWVSGKHELDIVAYKDTTLVVVEVKTRASLAFERPEEAVTPAKVRRIMHATDAYIRLFDIPFDIRFDIISIYREGAETKIDHIEDAFYPPLT